jgi:hypothetical protein
MLVLSITLGLRAVRRFRQGQSFGLREKALLGSACILLSFLCYLGCYFYLRWTGRLSVQGFRDSAHLCWSDVNNPSFLTEQPILRGRGSFFRLAFVLERNGLVRGYPLWNTSFAMVPPTSYRPDCRLLHSNPNYTSEIKKRWPFLAPLQFNYAMSSCHKAKETVHFSCARIYELYAKLLQDNQFPRREVILDGVAFDRRTMDLKKSFRNTAQFTLRDTSLIGFHYKRAKLLLNLNQYEVQLMLESDY